MFSSIFNNIYNTVNSVNSLFFRVQNNNYISEKDISENDISEKDMSENDISEKDISEKDISDISYNDINDRKIYFLKNGLIKNQISYVPYKFKSDILEIKRIFNIKKFEFIMTIDEEEELETEREYYINKGVLVVRIFNIIKIPESMLDIEDYLIAIFYAKDAYLI